MKNLGRVSIFALIVGLMSFQLIQIQNVVGSEFSVYDNEELAINYPSNWKMNANSDNAIFLTLTSKLDSKKDKFAENINMIRQSVGAMELDEYYPSAVETMKSVFKFKVISETSGDNYGVPYKQVVYSGKMVKVKVTMSQRVFIHNEKVYVITSTSSKKGYSGYENLFTKINDSLKFK